MSGFLENCNRRGWGTILFFLRRTDRSRNVLNSKGEIKVSFNAFRTLFPQLNQWTYLDSAMLGLTPLAFCKAGNRVLNDYVWLNTETSQALPKQVRSKIAELLGVTAEEIALTGSTTQGLNIIASALDFKPGDNVVVSACEHPSNLYPWTNLRRLGVEVRVVPCSDGILRVDEFSPYVDSNTKVVAASLITFYPGGMLDVNSFAELAHSVGALLVLDAAQAAGFVPINPIATGADIIVAPSYKGFMSGHGGGFIYIRRELLPQLQPTHLYLRGTKGDLGIWGSVTDTNYSLVDTAMLLEVNTVPDVVLAQMDKALSVLMDLGVDNIARHTQTLATELALGLAELGFEVEPGAPSHIVCVRTPQARELGDWLKERHILASARRYGLRFGLFAYNNEADVTKVLSVLREWKN